MPGRILLLLLAVIMLAAGAGAAKTFFDALKEERVMTGGRRVSVQVTKAENPSGYWVSTSYNGVVAVALFGLGGWSMVSAFRKKKG
jgi:hypothetical protein